MTLTIIWQSPGFYRFVPAASQRMIASLVVRVTPPRCPELGDGRMKAAGSRLNSVIRVLSPKSDPPVVPTIGEVFIQLISFVNLQDLDSQNPEMSRNPGK